MAESTAHRYYKLGSELEYLRGLSSKSLTVPAELSAFHNLSENVPSRRYAVRHVVDVLGSVLARLEQMELVKPLAAAAELRGMLPQMQDYLGKLSKPDIAVLQDPFAERLVAVCKQVVAAVEAELLAPSA